MMLDLDKNKKYVLACSFGPDSMALFHLLFTNNFNFVVAHVNYHKRAESNYEQNALEKYCKEKGVQIEVLDTKNLTPFGNFQEWARNIRYFFFSEVEKKYKCDATLVAHQQDDFIETILLQEKRANRVKYQGIAREIEINNCHVIRPLLNLTKHELLSICKENNVPFSIDSSNLEDHYERNKIRHSIVEKMSDEERKEFLQNHVTSKQKILLNPQLELVDFLLLKNEEVFDWISTFLDNEKSHRNISAKFIEEIIKKMHTKRNNLEVKLTDKILLLKSYEKIILFNTEKTYEFKCNINDKICSEFLDISFENFASDFGLKYDDFPVLIKPVSKDDLYEIKNYEVKVRRLFIDWKMPIYYRYLWPGIYSSSGKLIYIPRYQSKNYNLNKTHLRIKFTR